MAPFVSPNHNHSTQTSMSRFGGTSELDYLTKNMSLSNQRSPSVDSTTPGDQSPSQTSPQSPTPAYSKVARSAGYAFDTAHGVQLQSVNKTSHPLSIESRYGSPAPTPGPSSSSPWSSANRTSNLANSAIKAHDYYPSPLSSPFMTGMYTPAQQHQQKDLQQSLSYASYSTLDNPALVITERALQNATGYALRRDNGTYTRLVALDELPQIIGISATLQGPQGCIIVPVPGLHQPPKNLQWVGGVPRALTPSSTPSTNGSFRHYDALSSAGHTPYAQGIRSVSSSGPSMSGSPAFRNFNAQQPRKEKIYCDKWVHDGVCAFAQQGCKYKHEMPMDVATQRSLGLFHGLPAWWKREHGVVDLRGGSEEGKDGGRRVSVENARQTLKGLLVSSASNSGAQYGATAGGGGVNATLSSWRMPQGPVHGPGKNFGQTQPQQAAHGGLYGECYSLSSNTYEVFFQARLSEQS